MGHDSFIYEWDMTHSFETQHITCPMRRTHDVRHDTDDVRHDTDDVRHDTDDVRHDTDDVRHDTDDVRHDTDDVRHDTDHYPGIITLEFLVKTIVCTLSHSKIMTRVM